MAKATRRQRLQHVQEIERIPFRCHDTRCASFVPRWTHQLPIPRFSVEIERLPDRRCQQFLLIGKEEPDLTAQCRNRDCDNVVDADDGIFLEPVTHTYWNFGR